jgi:hypothetical protein
MRGVHPNRVLFDLGLAISGATLASGDTRSLRDIAAFCSAAGAKVSWQAIWHIEQRAFRKLRVRLQFHKDPVLREIVGELLKR